MTTSIHTGSKNYFNKIQNYLTNKRVFFTPSLNNGVYTLTIFDLTSSQTTSLIQKMTKHFHLAPNQQEPLFELWLLAYRSAMPISSMH